MDGKIKVEYFQSILFFFLMTHDVDIINKGDFFFFQKCIKLLVCSMSLGVVFGYYDSTEYLIQ